MAEQPLNGVLQHLRKMAAVQTCRELSDRDLLERFIGARDEAAYTVLIDRHGPMVFGVCRRALPNFHDAEDACQATFLVLARKAASVRKKTSLSSWLHGVACRVAANLKRNHARRKAHERGVAAPPASDPAAEISWREVQTILDEELQRLPDRYRAPLILCYLECLTRDEAAQQLGLSPTTLHGRLERARELLHERVVKRGLTLAAAMSAAALGESVAQAALPATFVVSSTKAAMLLAVGQPLMEGVVATKVIALMQEVTKAMFLAKLKLGAAALLCAGLFVALIGGSLTSLLFAQDARPAQLGEIVPGTEKDRVTVRQTESDLDFIRRISKELRDTAPTPAEIHFFVSSKDAGRRQKLIELFTQERQAKKNPSKRVELRARVTGYLIKVHFKAGDTVKKDQLLFEIDPRPYQAVLDAAEAKLQLADANGKFSDEKLKRAKRLYDAGNLSREDYTQSVTDHAAAEAGRKLAAAHIAAAQLNVEFTKIHAFIDGKIGAPALNAGNLVTADATSLAVIDSVDPAPGKQ
jgi:RNA polymerase sigma factor (sigma-70 family)